MLPGEPAAPGTQVPPQIETPGQTPHPDTNSAPQGVPMTNGTPAACYQKNAREFLAGDVQTSVMAHYAPDCSAQTSTPIPAIRPRTRMLLRC